MGVVDLGHIMKYRLVKRLSAAKLLFPLDCHKTVTFRADNPRPSLKAQTTPGG
jgi:hypothetical protein